MNFDTPSVSAIIILIITAGVGILGTYLAAIQKYPKDLEIEFDKNLRSDLISAY